MNGYAEDVEFEYNDHAKRDPLWPLVGVNGSIMNYDTDFLITDLALEGIITGADGQNLAILNGRIVGKNGRIGQFDVFEVNVDSVILKNKQEKFKLELK